MNNNLLKEISLSFGEITEEIFFNIRKTISFTLKFLKQQINELSDNPNIPIKEISEVLKNFSQNIEKLETFSNETLLFMLFHFSEFLGKLLEFIRPFEPHIYNALYQDIQFESLYSQNILESKAEKTLFYHQNQEISLEKTVQLAQEEYFKNIIVFFPPVISDESIWENSMTKYLQQSYITLKLRINPYHSIYENIDQIFELMQKLNMNPNQKKYLVGFGTGNLIIHYLLYQYYKHLDNSFQIIFINSPELGIKIERYLIWAGIGLQYFPKESIRLFQILMNSELQTQQSLTYGKIEFIKNKKNLDYLKKFNIYKIYSLISENNSFWKQWLGDGFTEESSLCYLDTELNENNIYVLSGVSYLQVLNSYGLRYILSNILQLSNF